MTNEQLAEILHNGEHPELQAELWERVRVLLHSMSDSEYRKRPEQFQRCGVTAEDLKQVCYIDVFLKAVERYDSTRGLKFTTYLTYPFWRAVDTLLGTINGKQNTRPLDNYSSLDAPVNEVADGEPLTLADVIPDDDLIPLDDQITRKDTKRIVRAAVRRLEHPHKDYLEMYFFKNMSLPQIGELYGISKERVRQQIQKGLRVLREDETLRALECTRDLDRLGRQLSAAEYPYTTEYIQGFDNSPEYAAALEQANTTPPQNYGERQALIYEARFRYWRRVRREQQHAREQLERLRARITE